MKVNGERARGAGRGGGEGLTVSQLSHMLVVEVVVVVHLKGYALTAPGEQQQLL